MQRDIVNILKELKGALQQIYGENLRGVYLYGSYASREEDPQSDIDVAIVLNDFGDYWEEVKRTGQLISELSIEYGVSISPVRIPEAQWMLGDSPFLNNVGKECVLV
jgi:predicted nucleotidyltransferase